MARFESTTVGSSDVPAATLPRTGGGRSTRRGADARGRRSRTARDPCLRRSRRRASFGEPGGSDKNVSLEGWALYTCFAERTHAAGRDQLSSESARRAGWRANMAGAGKLAILVGGGPAPGINSVIGAATIRAVLEGVEVIGIRDGFDRIMHGAPDAVIPLTIDKVSRLHFRGGSLLGISRANPTKDKRFLVAARDALADLGVRMLITIGGDDTAFSSMKLSEVAEGRRRVAHRSKTIGNDPDPAPHIDTFGFQTARHLGVELVKISWWTPTPPRAGTSSSPWAARRATSRWASGSRWARRSR